MYDRIEEEYLTLVNEEIRESNKETLFSDNKRWLKYRGIEFLYKNGDIVWHNGIDYIGPVKIVGFSQDILGYYAITPLHKNPIPIIDMKSLRKIDDE